MRSVPEYPKYTVSGKAMQLMVDIAAALERYKIILEGPEGVRLRIADKRGGKIENMKVRKGFVLRKVGDTQYAVATGEALKYFKGMLKLNEVGAYMFTLLQEDTNANKIADRILESFDADKETVLADVNDFIAKLKSINVIED